MMNDDGGTIYNSSVGCCHQLCRFWLVLGSVGAVGG